MPRISEVSGEFLREAVGEGQDLFGTIDILLEEGKKIVGELGQGAENFSSAQEFFSACDAGETALFRLEGGSKREDNKFILQDCPMAVVLDKSKVDGKLPESFGKFVEQYKAMNPDNAAIFHPGCVIHQFVRAQLVSNISIGGEKVMNYHQLGCGSQTTGKVVYDNAGMAHCASSPAEVDRMLDKGPRVRACVYAVEKVNI